MTIIGMHLNQAKRKKVWLDLLELRRSYEKFKNGPSEHEFNIANMDKQVYTYYLNQYAKAA